MHTVAIIHIYNIFKVNEKYFELKIKKKIFLKIKKTIYSIDAKKEKKNIVTIWNSYYLDNE